MSKKLFYYGSTSSYTARTLAFLAATGISDTTIANALNTMDLALIANGLDTKMKALYPFVGGTATTHKYNFMNPADTDAAFRLTFAGGWTHSATGAKPNGTTGYANSHFKASVNLSSVNSYHQSFYSRLDTAAAERGCMGTLTPSNYWNIFPLYLDSRFYCGLMTSSYMSSLETGSKGLYLNSRTASNASATYRNATQRATSATAPGTVSNLDLYIGAINFNGGTYYYTNIECAFSSIGDGLSSTEEGNFYTLIQNFNTALSRQV